MANTDREDIVEALTSVDGVGRARAEAALEALAEAGMAVRPVGALGDAGTVADRERREAATDQLAEARALFERADRFDDVDAILAREHLDDAEATLADAAVDDRAREGPL